MLMNFKNIFSIVCAGVVALSTMSISAQSLQSVSSYRKAHADLLAKQKRINEQIKLEETQQYAQDLYGEVEPEIDIYTEGWESGLVNPYKESDVPATKKLDVRNYVMPVKSNFVTSNYGYRPRFGRMHKGIDLRAAIGDTVRAAFSGKVRLTKYERGGYGFYVIVRHDNGLETVYGHLSRFLVKPEQVVKAGQPIALSGNTGGSTGPHLHFETRFMGYAINPEAIFDFENRTTHTDYYTFTKSNYTESRSYRRSAPARQTTYTASRNDNVKQSYSSKSSRSHEKSGKHGKKHAESKSVEVKSGDNLAKIAAKNGTTVAQLKKMNGIKGDKIKKGQKIKVK